MKRCLLAALLLYLVLPNTLAQRVCETHTYLQQAIQQDPSLAGKLAAIERSANKPDKEMLHGPGSSLPVIKIPVVVHIIYNAANENISDAQVRSQIDVLNKDFRKLNADTTLVPAVFKSFAADGRIEFSLATTDPRGRATNGILRKQTGIRYFGMDDRIKSSAHGGDDGWDPDSYLNIWVGNLAGGLIGYASPVGGAKDKDGVVITYTAFGTMGTAAVPYHKGRTATHEIGHWLGLRHIWGDTYCGNDYVDDTPPQRNSSTGCPSGVVTTCDNAPYGNMYMNFMDLTDDACTNLFTFGQTTKMRKLFVEGGPRHALLSSNGCNNNPLPAPIELPVETPVATSLRAWPNPGYDMITVTSDENLSGKMITIHNHLGQLVLQSTGGKGTRQLDIRHLKEGMYFIRAEGLKTPFKLIKTGNRPN